MIENPDPDQKDLEWRSASGGNGGSCVELAKLPDGGFAVRDSKDRGQGPVLRYNAVEMAAFFEGLTNGVFADIFA